MVLSVRTLRLVSLGLFLSAIAACADRPTATPRGEIAPPTTAPPMVQASSPAPLPAASTAAPSPPPAPLGPPRAIDMHVDTPWQVKFKGKAIELVDNQATLKNLKDGRYGGIVYPIYISDKLHGGHPTIRDADEIFDWIDRILKTNASVLWPDAKGPTPEGMVTAYVSIEGAGAFAADIKAIDRFIARGVVFVGPVHWNDDKLASSATGTAKAKSGLSALGKKFCERVYAAGGIVDVSHMSDRGFDDLVPIAAKYGAPIVATHSNARAIADHPRNLTDEQLRRIAATGGVAGLNFYREYVKLGPEKDGAVADLVKHALHMIDVAGVDHVGIGSDFDGGDPVSGLEDAGKIQALADALVAGGGGGGRGRGLAGRRAQDLRW